MALNLVIDTSMAACSVGLFNDYEALFEQCLMMRHGHQEALGGLVYEAIKSSQIALTDLNSIGVTLGPGSFTGLRIGLSFAKGLSVGANVRLVGLSALEAMLFHPDIETKDTMALMDGGRGKLFVQMRHRDCLSTATIVDTKDPEQVSAFRVSLGKDLVVTGNGYDHEGLLLQTHPTLYGLNRLLCLGHGKVDVTPLYMREADASVSQKPILQL